MWLTLMMSLQSTGPIHLRLYEMFMGPLDVTKPWDEKGVKGVFGFLGRTFRFFSNPENIVSGVEDAEDSEGASPDYKKSGSRY